MNNSPGKALSPELTLVRAPILVLAVALIAFVFTSYPQMRPGFDMWTHLGLIDAPQEASRAVLPTSRILWHHIWHRVLEHLAILDVFDRALVIHRVQALLTIILVTLGSYFTLRVLTDRNLTPRFELWFAALLSTVIWLLMHGTESTARGGGPGSHLIQSWLVWYSLNYQISLPLYLASVGALLYALNARDTQVRQRVAALALSLACISIATLLHAAETSYFFICAGILIPLHVRGRKAWLMFGLSVFLAAAALWGVIQRVHIMPALIKMILADDWSALIGKTHALGILLTTKGLNRIETSWHALHTMSLAAICVAALIRLRHSSVRTPEIKTTWRPWIFAGLTALFPLALMQPLSAGFLATITHLNIAWRFSLASFLFVCIPLLGLWLATLAPIGRPWLRQLILGCAVFGLLGISFAYSHQFERKEPSLQFAKSLLFSLDRDRMHFGLSDAQRNHLSQVIQKHQAHPSDRRLICTDLFTAYYLFFVMRYREVNLPKALKYVPGYLAPDPECRFKHSPESLS